MGQFSTDGIEQYCQQNDREHESPAGWIWARLPTRQKPVKDLPMSYMHIYTHTHIYIYKTKRYVRVSLFTLMHADKHAGKGRTKQNFGEGQSDILFGMKGIHLDPLTPENKCFQGNISSSHIESPTFNLVTKA